MTNRPLHEVVLERALIFADEPNEIARDLSPELAAVLEAADALRKCSIHASMDEWLVLDNAYDAAVADLRRALEGK